MMVHSDIFRIFGNELKLQFLTRKTGRYITHYCAKLVPRFLENFSQLMS